MPRKSNVEAIKKKYGEDYFKNLGRKGGQKSSGGGFAHMAKNDRERLIEISSRGGSNSKRSKK